VSAGRTGGSGGPRSDAWRCWRLSRSQSPTCICACLWPGTASRMGCGPHALLCGRDDRRRVYDILADSRSGEKLPRALLVAGSVASLAANVAVAEPCLIGRVIAAWPSFALTASYELLTRQARHGAAQADSGDAQPRQLPNAPVAAVKRAPTAGAITRTWQVQSAVRQRPAATGRKWALANRTEDGSLPSGSTIARTHGHQYRWGRLVKNADQTGVFGSAATVGTGSADDGAGGKPRLARGCSVNLTIAAVQPGDPRRRRSAADGSGQFSNGCRHYVPGEQAARIVMWS
jgi:hypothetical protein